MSSDTQSSLYSRLAIVKFDTAVWAPNNLVFHTRYLNVFNEKIWPAFLDESDSYSALASSKGVSSFERFERLLTSDPYDVTELFLESKQYSRPRDSGRDVIQYRLISRHNLIYTRIHSNYTIDFSRVTSEVLLNAKDYPKLSIGNRLCEVFTLSSLRRKLLKEEAKEVTPKAAAPSCLLTNLPVFIIQYITGELPLSSQAVLALVSRSLHSAIGSVSWTKLSAKSLREEHLMFLKLLARDTYATHWLCESCSTLHCKIGGLKMNYFALLRLCPYSESSVLARLGALYWAHVYLVMERHRYGGTYGLPIEALSQNFIRKIIHPRTGREFSQNVTQEGKISNNELLVHTRLRTAISPPAKAFWVEVCQHIRGPSEIDAILDEEYTRVLRCRMSHLGYLKNSCQDCPRRMRRCNWCAIEYDFSVKKTLFKEVKLDLSVWANLGTGRDPDDLKWRLPQTRLSKRSCNVTPQNFECGSIRRRFEAA